MTLLDLARLETVHRDIRLLREFLQVAREQLRVVPIPWQTLKEWEDKLGSVLQNYFPGVEDDFCAGEKFRPIREKEAPQADWGDLG